MTYQIQTTDTMNAVEIKEIGNGTFEVTKGNLCLYSKPCPIRGRYTECIVKSETVHTIVSNSDERFSELYIALHHYRNSI